MKSIDLLKALNHIDDKLLVEADGVVSYSRKKIAGFKRYLTIAGSMAAILAVAVISTNIMQSRYHSGSGDETVQVANPMTECSSLKEAADITGFELSVPDRVAGDPISSIYVYTGSMIEVNYGDDACYIRKAAGNEDISGDYNEYGFSQTTTIGDIHVMIKGDGDLVKLVTWTNEGFSYAMHLDSGMALEDISAIIENIK